MKLKELSLEQKIRLLAELDGYERIENWDKSSHWYEKKCADGCTDRRHYDGELPNYLTSYDAIIPLVQKLPSYEQQVIAEKIYKQGWLSPSQLCDAVLVATGKAEV